MKCFDRRSGRGRKLRYLCRTFLLGKPDKVVEMARRTSLAALRADVLGTPSCLARIRANYARLRRSEQKVADYILSEPARVVYSAVTEVAHRSGVSDATVIRLCRALGFSGFQELKIALSRELVAPERHIHQDIRPDDDLPTAVRKAYRANQQALEDTLANLDIEALKRVIDRIRSARRIHLYGSGTSGLAVLDAHYKLLRIGIESSPFVDVHLRASAPALLGSGDVVIAFSHSGSTRDVVDAVAAARAAGAWIVAVTNHAHSPLARHADVVLVTAGEETPFGSGGIPSVIAQLSVVDALFVGLSLATYDRALRFIEKTAEGVKSTKY